MNIIVCSPQKILPSLLTSVLVCAPSLLFSCYIVKSNLSWSAPSLVMTGVLCVGLVDFVMTVALEHRRGRLGRMTIPAVLSASSAVFAFVIAESMNRFVLDVDYTWLLPAVGAALVLNLLAVFSERNVVLKLFLSFNALVLAVLWELGSTGKIWLPF